MMTQHMLGADRGYTREDLAVINECIDDYNDERPDDKIRHVSASSTFTYIRRVIRYLGVVLS